MIDRNSTSYKVGKFAGRITLIVLGYILGKNWAKRPIDKGYPKKKDD